MYATVSTAVESRVVEETRYPTAIFSLHLRRKPLYYVINLIIPCFLLSIIALSTFLIHPGSYDRVGIGTYAFLVTNATIVRYENENENNLHNITLVLISMLQGVKL